MAAFRELRAVNVKFSFCEKAHPCTQPRRLTYYTRENQFGGLGCGALEEPKKEAE